ncbi:MAG TPA: hypothetical protein VH440_00185 [Candidatus Limnocylindrales bacterium]
MTALPIRAPEPADIIREPSLRRLLGAAIVGGLGVIAFSVAFGSYVAANMHTLPSSAAADARALLGSVPAIVALGVAHLILAAALAGRRESVRIVGAAISGLIAIAAAAAAAMTAVGVDPFAWSGSGHPSSAGVGILAITAILYGAAALLAGGATDE